MEEKKQENRNTSGIYHNLRSPDGKFVSSRDIFSDDGVIRTLPQLQEAIRRMVTKVYQGDKGVTADSVLKMQRLARTMLELEEHLESKRKLKKLKSIRRDEA